MFIFPDIKIFLNTKVCKRYTISAVIMALIFQTISPHSNP